MQNEPNIAQAPFRIDVADRVKRLPPYLFGKINALKHAKRRAANVDCRLRAQGGEAGATVECPSRRLSIWLKSTMA